MATKTPSAKQKSKVKRPVARVAVLDAGGQYVDLVKKAVERQGWPADVLPLRTSRQKLEARYQAIIISGSPASSHQETAPQVDENLWQSRLPILGICYGMQAMAIAHGGKVAKNTVREDGRITTVVDTGHPLFRGIGRDLTALFTHGDFVTALPPGFTALGQHFLAGGSIAYSAIAKDKKIGVQFHPEVFDDTPSGYQLFQNFLEVIAGLIPDESFQEARLRQLLKAKRRAIVQQVGRRHVIAFVSGGVDSSVAATLAASMIPAERFHAFFIDNGFMRDEDDMVIEAMRAAGIAVQRIDAIKEFEQATAKIDGQLYGPLVSVTEPEQKRKIIGKAFIDVQNRLIASLKLTEAMLLQGTNAADRIESGHSIGDVHTMTIKTHHNQVKEVQELKDRGLLIEPLDDLFKDEVRELGREVGLPEELVERQPFPGPGLAIRIMTTAQSLKHIPDMPQQAAIQAFLDGHVAGHKKVTAHLLPVSSVGVGGDERSQLAVVAIGHADLAPSGLAALAHDLPAHFRDSLNRVIYALRPGSLADYSVTKTLLGADERQQLRRADKIVHEEIRAHNLLREIKQFPVILLPLSFGKTGQRSIVLRPVTTTTFMTVQAMLPGRELPVDFVETTARRITAEVPGISQVFLDLTNKPPATTEWE